MRGLNRALEVFWMIVTLVSFGMTIWFVLNDGWDNAWYYFGFPFLAAIMWAFRRAMRKRYEKDQTL